MNQVGLASFPRPAFPEGCRFKALLFCCRRRLSLCSLMDLNHQPTVFTDRCSAIELRVSTDDVLLHEVPKPFGSQNASRRLRFRLPVTDALPLSPRAAARIVQFRGVRPRLPVRTHTPTAPRSACRTDGALGTLPAAGLTAWHWPRPDSPIGRTPMAGIRLKVWCAWCAACAVAGCHPHLSPSHLGLCAMPADQNTTG